MGLGYGQYDVIDGQLLALYDTGIPRVCGPSHLALFLALTPFWNSAVPHSCGCNQKHIVKQYVIEMGRLLKFSIIKLAYRLKNYLQSLDIPTARHFLKRQYWQRFRFSRITIHLPSRKHLYSICFCMLRRKNPCTQWNDTLFRYYVYLKCFVLYFHFLTLQPSQEVTP